MVRCAVAGFRCMVCCLGCRGVVVAGLFWFWVRLLCWCVDLVVWVIVEFGLDACIVGLFVWMLVLGCC